VEDVFGPVLGAGPERVERVDNPLAAQLDLHVLRGDEPELRDLAVRAPVLPDERLTVNVEVNHDLTHQVDAGATGRRTLHELHDPGRYRPPAHAPWSVRRYAFKGSVAMVSASSRTHA
jgi:hypothetical protein